MCHFILAINVNRDLVRLRRRPSRKQTTVVNSFHVTKGEDEHMEKTTEGMQPREEEDGNTTETTTHREDNEPRNEKTKLLTNADKCRQTQANADN